MMWWCSTNNGAPYIFTFNYMEKNKEKKKGEQDTGPVRDALAVSLAEALNKGDEQVAFFLDAQDDNPSTIVDWVSTGNDMLDLAIANQANSGMPVGRIIELNGLEGTGKSLLAAHVLAATQKKGGMAVFIDTEYAASSKFLGAIGCDLSSMLHLQNLITVEDIFDKIEAIVAHVRKTNQDRLVTIVVDSIAAATTKKELASDHGADGYATGKAIAISKAMRKITELIATQRILLVFTNQLRQKIGFVGVGDPWTTSGGKSLAFHSSVRIRLKTIGQLKSSAGENIGVKCRCTVIKNRMGPPMRSVEFNIFFDRGIDNYGNWLEKLMDWDIVTNAKKEKPKPGERAKTKKQLEEEKASDKKAKSLQFIMAVDGKEPQTVVFEKRDLPKLLTERPECKEYLYKQICEHFIMKYKTPNTEMVEDMELDSGEGAAEE